MIIILLVISFIIYLCYLAKPYQVPSRDWSKVPVKGRSRKVRGKSLDREIGELGLTLFLMDEFTEKPNGD